MSHEAAPGEDQNPLPMVLLHSEQAIEPAAAEYSPALHSTQAVEPATVEAVPAGHGEQVVAPANDAVPAGQRSQPWAPSMALALPGSQVSHSADPEARE